MTEEKKPSLEQLEPLTEDDILYLVRHNVIGSQVRTPATEVGQVVARFALEQIRAVNKFEQSSSRLSRRIYWLTWLSLL